MTRAREIGAVPTTPADAIDRRTGGAWSRGQRVKNFFIAAVVRAALRVADRIPEPTLLWLGRVAGAVAARALGALRRDATRRAARCLPPADAERVAHACLSRAGENLATILLLRRAAVRASNWVDVSQQSELTLRAALSRGRGAIFVSAHVGPFELVAARIAELGYAPAVVVRESYDPRLDAWVDAHRLARGVEVIHRGAPRSGLRVVRAIRAGRPVGLLPDLGGRVASAPVHFLGVDGPFPIGPQELAIRLGAPLLVGTLVRRRGAPAGEPPFTLEIDEIEPEGDTLALTQRVAHRLGAAILSSPEDWLWMARGSRGNG